jgi:NAD(P)H dehydrogenase (quinone)
MSAGTPDVRSTSGQRLIGITGSTGRVGSRVARALADRGVSQRLLVRDPAKAPAFAESVLSSYDEPAGLAGVDTLFMVSAAEHPDRVGQHLRFLDAAAEAGVARIVYTSYLGAAPDAAFSLARHHWATEEHLRGLGIPFVALRDSLYADFLPLMRGADGVIRGPAGEGRFAPVAIDDVAACAVAALLDPAVTGAHELTGPALMTVSSAAAVLSAHGMPTRFEDETVEEAYASRASYGAPDWEVEGWVTSYLAIRDGSLDRVTDGVRQLSGREPKSLEDLLR